MIKITPYFKRQEFACKCGCGFSAVDVTLLSVLHEVRIAFGAPVKITSGCRCEKHNKAVGGAAKSYHVKGMAVDIQVSGKTPKEVQEWLIKNYPDRLGIGFGKTFTHIDVRQEAARFNY